MSQGLSSFGSGTLHAGHCQRERGEHPPWEVRCLEVFFAQTLSSFPTGSLHGGRSRRDLRHCVEGRVVCSTVFSAPSRFSAEVPDQVRAWVQQRWRHGVPEFARQLQKLTEQESSKRRLPRLVLS